MRGRSVALRGWHGGATGADLLPPRAHPGAKRPDQDCLPRALTAGRASLEATFIGNEAVAFTDGRVTLVTDYPYQPGYSGYMKYHPTALRPRGPVLLLVTHRHLDHFDPAQPRDSAWRFLGPREVGRTLPAAGTIAPDSVVTVGDIRIRSVPTPHANVEHYSYRVDWMGRSLYFVGDTDDPTALLAQRGLDVAFVTPWLWRTVRARGATIDAGRVVIYHHQSDESVPGCTGTCRVPRQGDRWTIERATE
jgi:hypothetical protein